MSSPVDTGNRFAPPTAPVEDVHLGGLALGSRWARLGAALIDGLLQAAIFFGLSYLILGRFTALNANQALDFGHLLRQLAASFALFLVLQGYLLVKRGQTIGKRLVGLRIVRTGGSQVSAGRMLGLRYLLGWVLALIPIFGSIYALVDILLIFRPSRKCLHDNIADTIVVEA